MLGIQNESNEFEFEYHYSTLHSILYPSKENQHRGDSMVVLQQPDAFKERLKDLYKGIIDFENELNGVLNSSHHQLATTPAPVEPDDYEENHVDVKVIAKDRGMECMKILLPLITSSLRHATFTYTRLVAVKLLTEFTKYVNDEIILQYILPHLMTILEEKTRLIRQLDSPSSTSEGISVQMDMRENQLEQNTEENLISMVWKL